MGLSSDLISQFVKTTNDNKKVKKETSTVYGTVTQIGDQKYVQFDGSDTTTPVASTVDVQEGNRVIVTIKDHTATITGNLTNPSANSLFKDSDGTIKELGVAVADRVTADQLNAVNGYVKELQTENATIKKNLEASSARINDLEADDVRIKGRLEASEGAITELDVHKLDAEEAHNTYATIVNLESTNADINNLRATHAEFENTTTSKFTAVNADINELDTKKLDAESAKVIYANIDFSNIGKAAIEQFFSKSGMIGDLVVGDGTITGKLVGVTISGDLIEGNTVKAEKLVVKGSDGLYYKLNIEAGATTSSEVSKADLQNGLHGTAIIAKTITAEKISVDDLVAFGATIGGFTITEGSLYSGVKTSVDNTTRGTYLDSDGQVAFGDSSNFIKYYQDTAGNYKLAISANSILLGSSKKNVETVISEVNTKATNAQDSVNNLEIGGRNLIPHSKLDVPSANWNHNSITCNFEEECLKLTKSETTARGYYNQNGIALPRVGHYYTASIEAMKLPNVDIPTDTSAFIRYVLNSSVIAELVIRIPTDLPEGKWTKLSNTFLYDDEIPSYVQATIALGKPAGGVAFRNFKYEVGNKVTDWTPAPEDMATSDEVDYAQTTADEANSKATNAETLIAQLSDSISMLVTDGNGTSLMTQTEDGWTFSTANIQNLVNEISENLNSLTNEVGSVDSAVDILQQTVDDLGVIAEYVKITTYEDEPCIELGEGDSDFKLRITNTQMIFTEGSTVLAYFSNQAFHSKKVVVEEELYQGGFMWKARSNGNLGLIWKGGVS